MTNPAPETAPVPRMLNVPRYRALLRRAVCTSLDPVEKDVHAGADSEHLYLFPALETLASKERRQAVLESFKV